MNKLNKSLIHNVQKNLMVLLRFDVLMIAGINSKCVDDTETMQKEVDMYTTFESLSIFLDVFRLPQASAA